MLNSTTASYGAGATVAGYVFGLVMGSGMHAVSPDMQLPRAAQGGGVTFSNLIAEDSASYLKSEAGGGLAVAAQLSVITLSLIEQRILRAINQVESGEYLVVPDGLTSEDAFFAWLDNAV